MSKRLKVGTVNDFGTNGRFPYDYEEEEICILVFNIDGEFYAIADECTHEELPLDRGNVYGCEIDCPYHHARFDLRTGEALTMPAVVPLKTYPVTVDDGDIYVEIVN